MINKNKMKDFTEVSTHPGKAYSGKGKLKKTSLAGAVCVATGALFSGQAMAANSFAAATADTGLLPYMSIAQGHLQTLDVLDTLETSRWWWGSDEGMTLIVSGQMGDKDVAPSRSMTNKGDLNLKSATIGMAFNLSEELVVGAVIHGSDSDLQISGKPATFDQDSVGGSIFGTYTSGGLFSTFIGTYTNLDHETDRSVVSTNGTVFSTDADDTDGEMLSGLAQIGFNISSSSDSIAFGPVLTVDYHDIFIDGYRERIENFGNSPAGDLVTSTYDDFDEASLTADVGLFLDVKGFDWVNFRFEVARVEQFENDPYEIKALQETSFDTSELLEVEGFTPDNNFLRYKVGMGAQINPDMSIRVTLEKMDTSDTSADFTGFAGINVTF